MAVTGYALGRLNPVVYFINVAGIVALPPSTEYALMVKDRMKHRGFELREAGTLAEIDDLQKRMQDQEYRANQARLEVEQALGARIRGSIRDRLYQRMVSSSTTPYEREFISNYLQVREDKRHKYQQRFMADQCYFEQREMNNKHHMQDVAARNPDSRDTACTKCGKFRRAIGTLCMRCAG